jgi:internalin A
MHRLSKFVKKYKQLSLTLALALIALIIFGVFLLIENIRDGDKSQAELLKERADKYYATMDFRNAVNFYNMALDADPEFEEVYIILHGYYIGIGDYIRAREILITALENTDSERLRYLFEHADYIVVFETTALTQRISELLGIAAGSDILRSDLDEITNFIWRSMYGDLEQLVHFRRLENLTVTRLDITDVSIFVHMHTLKELHINANLIEDISPLAVLPNLEFLNFAYNEVTDISVLRDFPSLDRVIFMGNPLRIIDYDAVSHIRSVQGLPERLLADADDYYVFDWANEQVRLSVVNSIWIPDGFIPKSVLDEITYLYIDGVHYARMSEADLGDLKLMPNLESLYFTNVNFYDFAAIEHLTKLQWLSFSYCYIGDTSMLGNFKNLTSVSFWECNIDTLVIENLPEITYIGIDSSTVQTLGLSGLPELNYASFRNSTFAEVLPSSGVGNLTYLQLSITDPRTLTQFSQFSDVTRIELTGDEYVNIAGLSAFPKLEELYLWGIGFHGISAISEFKNLRSLSLSDRHGSIGDFHFLAELPLLNELHLHLQRNPAGGDFPPLPNVERLTLYIGSSSSSAIPWLEGFSGLKALNISGELRIDFTSLAPLTSLTELAVYSWHEGVIPRDLAPLAGLTNLKHLTLSSNSIEDISPLAGLMSLEHLDLGHNTIEDISPLSGLVNLEELFLWNNRIRDFSPLAGLVNLRRLQYQGNPGESDTESIRHIIDNLEEDLGWWW